MKQKLLLTYALLLGMVLHIQTTIQAQSISQSLAASQKFNFFTIPNQSAAFVRMPARGASTEIDAVFHNPAGIAHLPSGWHISLNNQALRQQLQIKSSYQYYNTAPETTNFEGLISTPVFPSIYLACRQKKLSFSLGLNPVAGGGGARFDGLPVSERNTSDVVPNLQNLLGWDLVGANATYANITDYKMDFSSRGLAFFLGSQLGITYQFNEMFSFAVGVRYVYGQVGFTGHTRDIQINVPEHGGWQSPGTYLNYVKNNATGLGLVGPTVLENTAVVLDSLLADREIDVVQSGTGFTPIVGVNVKVNDRINIGLKYEHLTELELTTKVKDGKDGGTLDAEGNPTGNDPLFLDGSTERSDLPAFLTGGINIKIIPKLTLALGGAYLWNSKADFGGRDSLITNNYQELQTGLEYVLNEDITLSMGYSFLNWSVAPEYQTDVDFWTDAHSFAFGGRYTFTDKVKVNIGVLTTRFSEESQTYEHKPIDSSGILPPGLPLEVPVVAPSNTTSTYSKNALIFAIGTDVRF